MTTELCECGLPMVWRRFNTPVNGEVKTTLFKCCLSCHRAVMVEEAIA